MLSAYIEIPENGRILDFGCGAAGTLIALKGRYPLSECFGCDVKADVIDWVRKSVSNITVDTTSFLPPLPENFSDFDFVYAISVWSHMPEQACADWLDHIYDRMNPEGTAFITIVEPRCQNAINNGFDPEVLSQKVKMSGGCLYDKRTDLTFIQREWLERSSQFNIAYFGPLKEHNQWVAILKK